MPRSPSHAAIQVKSPQDLGAGLLFVAIGVIGLYFGQDLQFGSSHNMGPGYFPTVLSALILIIGVIVAARSVAIEGPPIEEIRLRPLIVLVAGMLVFGYLIKFAGLGFTAALLAVMAAYAQPKVRLVETLIFAVALSAFVVIIFVYALGQPMQIFWGG
ncbi:MAG: tripartite tricarboxylate transporter TctB family protein [Candidatus Eiseniibacteriota bacterium]